jgi:hypothetical protein
MRASGQLSYAFRQLARRVKDEAGGSAEAFQRGGGLTNAASMSESRSQNAVVGAPSAFCILHLQVADAFLSNLLG